MKKFIVCLFALSALTVACHDEPHDRGPGNHEQVNPGDNNQPGKPGDNNQPGKPGGNNSSENQNNNSDEALYAITCSNNGTDYDYFGTCDGNTVKLCQDTGVYYETDCAAKGGVCNVYDVGVECSTEMKGANPLSCDTLGTKGTCSHNMAIWCNGEKKIETLNCNTWSDNGGTCALDTEDFYGCFAPCGNITAEGRCEGNTLKFCGTTKDINGKDVNVLNVVDCGIKEGSSSCGKDPNSNNYVCL